MKNWNMYQQKNCHATKERRITSKDMLAGARHPKVSRGNLWILVVSLGARKESMLLLSFLSRKIHQTVFGNNEIKY
jgi:hypothetical protein